MHAHCLCYLSPEVVFKLIVDRLLPTPEAPTRLEYWRDSSRNDPLDFACLRLSSRGVRALCDAAVRRLDIRNCSSDQMQALLH